MLAVADTHALVWYARGKHHKLGRDARRAFDEAVHGTGGIYVPVLVLVELAEMVRRGDLRVPDGFTRWAEALFATGRFFPVELSWEIVRRAETLAAIPERGDRLIAATAAQLECPLLTRDPEIAAAAGVETVW